MKERPNENTVLYRLFWKNESTILTEDYLQCYKYKISSAFQRSADG